MIFKLKDYSTSYRDVLKRKLAYSTKNRFLIVAETAAETGCHNLALLLFLEDLQGSCPDLSAIRKTLFI